MSLELLDAELVERVRRSKGITKKWIWETYLGLNRTDGYSLLKDGKLPSDPTLKDEVTRKLADFCGVEVRQILLRLSRPRRTA